MFNNFWLFLTESCNLQCKYCFNPNHIFKRSNTITLDNFKKIFANIKILHDSSSKNKRLKITIFGGEPLMYPKLLKEIVMYSHNETDGNIQFQLLTNGLLLSEQFSIIEELYEQYNVGIQISIDANPSQKSGRTHLISQQLYEDKINKTFEFLFTKRFHFNIRATLIPDFIAGYYENFHYFVELFNTHGLYSPSISFIPDAMCSEWTSNNYNDLDKEAEQIVIFLKDYYKKYSKLLHESFVRRALRILYYREILKTKKTRTSLCGFANNLFAVSPNGTLYACHRVYDDKVMKLGNLLNLDIDFEKIDAIRSVFNNPNAVTPHPELEIENCEECSLKYACSMVCPADLYKRTDEFLNIYCNKVVYKFHTIYLKHVENYLWPLMEEENFRNLVLNKVQRK